MKLKKRKKSSRMKGKTTHGHGSRKKWKKSGHKGGVGMAGTGKKGDQKKTKIIKLYGSKYFGKQGITSRKTKKKKLKFINLRDLGKYKEKEINLVDYKILGDGEITKAVTITAKAFTKSAKSKIEKAGGKALSIKSKEQTKKPITSQNKSNKPEETQVKSIIPKKQEDEEKKAKAKETDNKPM